MANQGPYVFPKTGSWGGVRNWHGYYSVPLLGCWKIWQVQIEMERCTAIYYTPPELGGSREQGWMQSPLTSAPVLKLRGNQPLYQSCLLLLTKSGEAEAGWTVGMTCYSQRNKLNCWVFCKQHLLEC